MLIEDISVKIIVAIASHSEGKHYMALDNMGFVYSWSVADGGLGHGDTLPRKTPSCMHTLECIKSIHCGCNYSAAISYSGVLYTWGRGNYGRLGHGNSENKLFPTAVAALKDYKVIDVSLGSEDSHTLCVTSEGLVFAWGDGDYGKLGNSSCNGSKLPVLVENLSRIQRVYAGMHFSIALSFDGKLYSWGKEQGGCLGHGVLDKQVQSIDRPKMIRTLQNKVIVDFSLGVSHCLALSSSGEVFGWGRNDYNQICPASICKDSIIREPLLATHASVHAFGIACGCAQTIIWSQTSVQGVATRIPFIIDLSELTFRLLDQLLSMVCGQDTNNRQTPNQESECVAVACLNLLRLQLHALIANGVPPKAVGLAEGSRLLLSLKTRILSMAGGSSVLKTMQDAAELTLQEGWSVLLPTAAERALQRNLLWASFSS